MKRQIHEAGYYVDADITDRKIDKKVTALNVFVVDWFSNIDLV